MRTCVPLSCITQAGGVREKQWATLVSAHQWGTAQVFFDSQRAIPGSGEPQYFYYYH